MSDRLVLVVGLFISYLGTAALRHVGDRFNVPVLSGDRCSNELRKWIVAGGLVAYVLLVEGRVLADIGIKSTTPLATVGWGVGGFVLTYLAGGVAMTAPDSVLKQPTEAVASMANQSVPVWGFTAVTAGVTESILFQGYPIERLADQIGPPVAAVISFLAFTVVHWFGDTYSIREVLFIAVPALCMTILYVATRNLFVVILAHTLVDSVSLASVHVAEEGLETEGDSQDGVSTGSGKS